MAELILALPGYLVGAGGRTLSPERGNIILLRWHFREAFSLA